MTYKSIHRKEKLQLQQQKKSKKGYTKSMWLASLQMETSLSLITQTKPC